MWMALLAVVDRLASLTLIRRDIGTDREDIASSSRRRRNEGNEAKRRRSLLCANSLLRSISFLGECWISSI